MTDKPAPVSRFDAWIEVHCYDCGYPHKTVEHLHCFDERHGPRPQAGCNCGGCRHARGHEHECSDSCE
jgi:hypothetical protein